MAVELIASVDGAPDEDAQAAWAVEIDQRVRVLDASGSKGEDWATVRARIEARLRSK